jgi:acyl-CoA synthetase (NDP forming)
MIAPARPPFSHLDLARLIDPRTIAIVGMSPRAGAFGMRSFENLAHFKGDVYFVNGKYDRIADRACYPSLAALPKPPDCVVLVVPKDGVEALLGEAADGGAGGVIVYASAYGEMEGGDGKAAQARIAAIARERKLRILGPNCIGLVNNITRAGMTFMPDYSKLPHRVGPVAIVSQSGALGYALLQAAERGRGFSHFISAGNSCDIDVADLIAFLSDDPACRAIICVFEGIRDAAKLLAAGERARRAGKPVVVYKLGASESGASAALSHTGSLASSHVAMLALFERAGFAVVDDFESLVETAHFLAVAGRPSARGVAVVSSSGGAGVIAADKAEKYGVPMPQPLAATTKILQTIVPAFGAARNPCDPTGQVLNVPESFTLCVSALLEDPQYGALVLPQSLSHPEVTIARYGQIRELADKYGKPIAIAWLSEWLQGPGSDLFESDERLSLFRSMDRCFAAIAAWHGRDDAVEPGTARRISDPSAKARVEAMIDESHGVLTEHEGKRALTVYGVPTVPDRLARSSDEAVSAAGAFGYPVALKIESSAIAHKTEAGGVRLNLSDAAAVRSAYTEILANARNITDDIAGVSVQPMARPGVEVIAGTRIDPVAGAVVLVGLGGVMVELMKDTVVGIAPVSAEEAKAMLKRLKGYRLLTGFRGSAAVDLDALADAIARISELGADLAEAISEIDVNPIIARPDGALAVDALISTKR